jgi:hypothetical protein
MNDDILTSSAAAAKSTQSIISSIRTEVEEGLIELLRHAPNRGTIVGASAANALLVSELIRQVERIADWHNRVGKYFCEDGKSGSNLPDPPIKKPALAAEAPAASGPSPSMPTPFMADVQAVLLAQLAARDALITGLRTDLTAAQTNIVDLQTKHAALSTTVGGIQTDLATAKPSISDLQTKNAALAATVSDVQTDLATAKSSIGDQQTKHAALAATVSDVQTDLAMVKSSIGDQQTKHAALAATVSGVQTDLATAKSNIGDQQTDLVRQDAAIQEIGRELHGRPPAQKRQT